MTMSTTEVIRSLKSTDCPGCGGFKRARRSVCSMCWSKLPSRIRSDLYSPSGKGYEKAVTDAVSHLGSPPGAS